MPYITPISTTLSNVWTALKELSTLGRLQVFILLMNVLGTCVVLNVASSEENHHTLDHVVFYFSLEFAIFTIIGILFTITVENVYAFWSLIFLQVQLAAFTTASAAIGPLHHQKPSFSWTIVAVNWLSIFVFLVLQRAVRRTWGWHAYKLVGGKADTVAMYDRYQQFCAALIADVFHAVFFATAEEIVIRTKAVWQPGLVWTTVALTIVLAKALQIAIRREHVYGLVSIFVFYVFGFCLYCFFAVENSIADKPSSKNISEENLPTFGERQLVVAIEWCIFVVRGLTLFTMVRTTSFFGQGLAQYFPVGTAADKNYLIDPSDEIVHKPVVRESRAFSRTSTVVGAGQSVNAPLSNAGGSNYGSASVAPSSVCGDEHHHLNKSPTNRATFIDVTAASNHSSPDKQQTRHHGHQVGSPRNGPIVAEAIVINSNSPPRLANNSVLSTGAASHESDAAAPSTCRNLVGHPSSSSSGAAAPVTQTRLPRDDSDYSMKNFVDSPKSDATAPREKE